MAQLAQAEIRGPGLGNSGARADISATEVRVGLGGMWKIGHITPIRVRVPAEHAPRVDSVAITTFDGEGVPVLYRQRADWLEPIIDEKGQRRNRELNGPQDLWCQVAIGRGDRSLSVKLLDYTGSAFHTIELSGEELGKALPTTQPWMVAIGSAMGIEATSFTDANTGLSNFSTSLLTQVDEVPPDWRGLDGCDVLVISTSASATNKRNGSNSRDAQPPKEPPAGANASSPLVAGLSNRQWHAIDGWIEQGGLAVLSVGEAVGALPADSPLRALLPGSILDSLPSVKTSPLEAATATNTQLAPISVTRLKDARGIVELSMLDSSGKRFPWWIRYSNGKGVVHFIGSDLDQSVLAAWKDRRTIWEKVLTGFWARGERIESQETNRNVSGSTYLGYDDLTGQLRATLDYFPSIRMFGFGIITAILSVLLIAIGPLDYWVSVHLLKRPHFSWYLSGAVLLLTCGLLIWLEDTARPKQLLLNTAQIVDYLPERKRVHVDSWTHVYSSRARTLDVSLDLQSPSRDARLDWQGLPGKGLGGMESNLLADQGMPQYSIHLLAPNEQVTSDGAASKTSLASSTSNMEMPPGATVSAVGIPASGTKCLHATWTSEFEPAGTSQLRELKGIDQIQGRLQNPLKVDLLRPMLFYHNWAYALPSRLRAGEELTISYDMVPKDLLRRLNRRQIVNNNDQITRWNPEDRQSLDRLMEIMMFYKASGGVDYSKLKHRFQPRVDISPLLALDHAVLLGELAEPVGQLRLAGVSNEQIKREASSTWCRVLLPVARPEE